jgi:hypothetical protein
VLGVCVVGRGNLNNVSTNEVDALEAADDGAKFAGGPAASLGGARCGGDYRDKDISQVP